MFLGIGVVRRNTPYTTERSTKVTTRLPAWQSTRVPPQRCGEPGTCTPERMAGDGRGQGKEGLRCLARPRRQQLRLLAPAAVAPAP